MMSISLRLAALGGGESGYTFVNIEADTYAAAMSVPPDDTRKALIDTFIGALKAASVYSTLDHLYILAAHDSQAAGLNVVSPATHTLTPVSSPTFVADRGYTGNGTSSYLSVGRNWSALPSFTQDEGSFGVWSTSTTAAAAATEGIIGADGQSTERLVPRDNSNLTQVRVSAIASASQASSDGSGHTGANRVVSNFINIAKNGVYSADISSGSTAKPTADVTLLKSNVNFSSKNIAAAHIGSSLSSGQWTALYDALLAYMQGVGAA